MIRTIIIDDETHARMALRKEIERNCPEVEIIGEADGVESGVDILKNSNPDLVFLDVRLADGNGFDILDQTNHLSSKVIFTTAYSEYAIKAIRFSALDYLLKPVNGKELKEAIERISNRKQEELQLSLESYFHNLKAVAGRKRIALQSSDGIHLIELSRIVRCTSESNYTSFFFTDGKRLMIAKTLKEFEELLVPSGFIRIHRSYLINLEHLKSYINKDNGYVKMSDNTELPVSQRKKQHLMDIIHQMNE
ncbi:MAG: response regulator transcription factor [Flavobacteriales bacterium]|nr:response regulator transcription factor [Flavobacteriales bacterium]MCB9447276.1 response regulator transcription factor [Flavobacteriales bacterium]